MQRRWLRSSTVAVASAVVFVLSGLASVAAAQIDPLPSPGPVEFPAETCALFVMVVGEAPSGCEVAEPPPASTTTTGPPPPMDETPDAAAAPTMPSTPSSTDVATGSAPPFTPPQGAVPATPTAPAVTGDRPVSTASPPPRPTVQLTDIEPANGVRTLSAPLAVVALLALAVYVGATSAPPRRADAVPE